MAPPTSADHDGAHALACASFRFGGYFGSFFVTEGPLLMLKGIAPAGGHPNTPAARPVLRSHRELDMQMSLVQLRERGIMQSDRIVGKIADNVFVCSLLGPMSG
jgi:hypothetical protein